MIAPAALALAKHARVLGALFALAAAGELVLDKLPRTPSRLVPLTLILRCIVGAVCAFLISPNAASAAWGLAGALAGSYAGAAYRRALPHLAAALVEDAVAIITAYFLLF